VGRRGIQCIRRSGVRDRGSPRSNWPLVPAPALGFRSSCEESCGAGSGVAHTDLAQRRPEYRIAPRSRRASSSQQTSARRRASRHLLVVEPADICSSSSQQTSARRRASRHLLVVRLVRASDAEADSYEPMCLASRLCAFIGLQGVPAQADASASLGKRIRGGQRSPIPHKSIPCTSRRPFPSTPSRCPPRYQQCTLTA
jgi:hypothetical protein